MPKVKAVRPADAASLILVDRSGIEPRILMGRRHAGHKFMPNHVVFPGGRVDPADRKMAAYGALAAHVEARLLARTVRGTPARARALALCAIRETYEETGILIGETGLGAPEGVSEPWNAFAQASVYPSLEALHVLARAITPPGRGRRFDARFFIADAAAIGARVDGIVGPAAELIETMWLTAEEARGEDLHEITRLVFDEAMWRIEVGLELDVPIPLFHTRNGRRVREEL